MPGQLLKAKTGLHIAAEVDSIQEKLTPCHTMQPRAFKLRWSLIGHWRSSISHEVLLATATHGGT
jgi:hypothetical protein